MSKMKKITNCMVCGESIEIVSMGLCQKLFGKNTEKLLCLACLSNDLDVEEEELLEKAREFKEAGCTLFK